LDSSFVVDFLDSGQDHHGAATAWMRDHREEPLGVPAVCAFEVLRGSARAGEEQFDRAVGFLRTLTVLELDLETAVVAGDLDGRLHAEGTPLGARDTLVAAPVLDRDDTLVTRDGDFEAVSDLRVRFYDRDGPR
jgi:predicted nucleic acid-binding protein